MSSAYFLEASTIGKDYDELFKCLLIGNSGVGKSSIVQTYVEPETPFESSYITTIGVDFKIRTCKWIDKQSSSTKTCKLQIWDTAGQERFRAIVTSYYRGAHGVILTYDLTDPKSLHGIEQIWLPEIDRYAHQNARLVLVGNKSDLAKHPHNASAVETTRMLAKDFDDRYQERIAAHIETSAKLGANVEHAFQALIDAMMVDRKRQKSGQGRGGGGGGGSGVTHRLSSSLPLGGRGDARERSSCMC